MRPSFKTAFLHEVRQRRAGDFPAGPMTAASGTAATVSVWACMALHQATTGQPVPAEAVAMVPAVVYPVQGLIFGAAWLGTKCLDAADSLRQAGLYTGKRGESPRARPGGPRPVY